MCIKKPTFEDLFRRLRALNRVCPDGEHYYIVLDLRYFHLYKDGVLVYRSSDLDKFFNRVFREICNCCYPYMPILID